jgi:hypothetical protein
MGLPKLGWTIPRQYPPAHLEGWGSCIAALLVSVWKRGLYW